MVLTACTVLLWAAAIGQPAVAAPAPPSRWELVPGGPQGQAIGEAASRQHGIGGYETGSFVKVNGTYHAYINELPNQMPWAKCNKLWWDATTQLGHWTASNISGPWTRGSTVRQTPSADSCDVSAFNFSACDIAESPSQTWNSGGLLYGRTALNGSAEVWSLFCKYTIHHNIPGVILRDGLCNRWQPVEHQHRGW